MAFATIPVNACWIITVCWWIHLHTKCYWARIWGASYTMPFDSIPASYMTKDSIPIELPWEKSSPDTNYLFDRCQYSPYALHLSPDQIEYSCKLFFYHHSFPIEWSRWWMCYFGTSYYFLNDVGHVGQCSQNTILYEHKPCYSYSGSSIDELMNCLSYHINGSGWADINENNPSPTEIVGLKWRIRKA